MRKTCGKALRVFWRGAAAATVLGLGIVGCGGGGGTTTGTSTTPPSITMATYVTRANALCEAADHRKAAALAKATTGNGLNLSKAEGDKLIVTVVLPLYRELVGELGALEAPTEHRAEIAKLLANYESSIKRSERDPASALDGKAFFTADEEAVGMGLRSCVL